MNTPFLEGKREGSYLCDVEGNRYIDGDSSAGIFNLGRRNAELAEELKQAMHTTDQGNIILISKEKALLAAALADFVPGPLECSLFAVTRGEAFDAACKIVRGFTGRAKLLSVNGGWYGQTGFAMSLSQRDDLGLYAPLVPECAIIPFGDLEQADRAIDANTAAVFLEPIQAENACRKATREYAAGLAELCKQRGALLVFDETQSNFGRTGTRFFHEQLGVSPDVLILGEALGGGMFPIAVAMMTQRVNQFMNAHPLIHLSTFGGSDLACCVARKALEVYARLEPWKNAETMGKKIRERLESMVRQTPGVISAVNGAGLLISLTLPTAERAAEFCKACLQHGLFVKQGKVARNTVLLRPSLLISEEETEALLAAVTSSFE